MSSLADRIYTAVKVWGAAPEGALEEWLRPLVDEVRELEAALRMIAGYQQCVDNLMGNVDIARAALGTSPKGQDEVTETMIPINNEIHLKQKGCYRIRIRGSDANYEVVARLTGFTVPVDGQPEDIILEFTSEHSYQDDTGKGERQRIP